MIDDLTIDGSIDASMIRSIHRYVDCAIDGHIIIHRSSMP